MSLVGSALVEHSLPARNSPRTRAVLLHAEELGWQLQALPGLCGGMSQLPGPFGKGSLAQGMVGSSLVDNTGAQTGRRW